MDTSDRLHPHSPPKAQRPPPPDPQAAEAAPKRAEEALARNARELAALDHMGKAVASTLDLAAVLKTVIDEASLLLEAEGVSVLLPEGESLAFAAASGPSSTGLVGLRIPLRAGVAGDVMRSGQSIRIGCDETEVEIYRDIELSTQYHTQSLLAVPLNLSGAVIGVMEAVHTQLNAFTLEDQRLLEAAANWAAIAIGNARQHERLQRRLQESEAIAAISRALNQTLDLQAILQLIVDSALRVIPTARRAVIHLRDEEQNALVPVAAAGQRKLGENEVLMRPGEGIAGRVFLEGSLINLGDASTAPDFIPGKFQLASLLVAPVESGARRLGALSVESEESHAFSADDEHLLTHLGVQAALAIENARLYETASRQAIEKNLLYNLSQSLTTTLDSREVSKRAIELTKAAMGADFVEIALVEPGTGRYYIYALTGYDSESVDEINRRAEMRVGQGFVGQVALTRKVTVAPDLARDPHWQATPGPEREVASAVGLPLLVGDELLGILLLLSQAENFFKADQIPTLTAVASTVALALQNARLFDAARERVEALTALHETALELSTQLVLPSLLYSLVERAARLLNSPMGALLLLSPDEQALEQVVSYNLDARYIGTRLKLGEGAAGLAAQTGKPMIVDDYPQWPPRAAAYAGAPFHSVVAVPIKWRGKTMGVISVNDDQPAAFIAADAELVGLFADQAAVAIANARQHLELQRRLQESDALSAISRALNETLELQKVLQLIVESARRIIPNVDRAVIHLLDEDQEALRAAAVSGEGESGQSVIMRPGEGVAGQVIAQGIVIKVNDTQTDPRYLAASGGSRTRSMLVAPVQSGEHRLGTLSVNSAMPNAFSADDERLIGTLGAQAALAIYNAQLYEDTRRQLDELLLLHTVALAGAEATSEDELISRATQLVGETVYSVNFGVLLIDHGGKFLHAHESYSSAPQRFVAIGEGIVGRVAQTGHPWLVPDVQKEPAYIEIDPNTRAELCVPLKAGNLMLGVINAESPTPYGFTETDKRLLMTLAGQLATAIQKLRFYHDLEQALRQEKSARAQLVQSEKLAAMGRLVASVAHELNNPLQAIQNALYLVKQEPKLGLQAMEDLQVAATEANRMAELINRLRETYRPTTGEEFRFESLNAIVTEVQRLIATHLRHNNIEFKFDPDPGLPAVPGIRDQLKQVMLNLCLNAVEAMPNGGQLLVRTRHDAVQSSILLTVEDTGAGIQPEVIHNVFDPFFTTKESGTGLGLTITYDIIQRHHGRIEVESLPGAGAIFRIWLPIEIASYDSGKHSDHR